jgi:hypothetical protein
MNYSGGEGMMKDSLALVSSQSIYQNQLLSERSHISLFNRLLVETIIQWLSQPLEKFM